MVLLIKVMYKGYEGFVEKHKEPLSDDYFLVGSPVKMLTITILYWLFIKKIGPKFMAKRPAYDLKYAMLVYNAFQVLLNITIFYNSVKILIREPSYYDWSCMRATRPFITTYEMNTCYAYYFAKIVDYIDTIFMVLRKRDRQITFLHVYHHILMVVVCYLGIRFLPGGHACFMGILNSFVHVVMYAYYFLAALRPGLRNSVGWKKHITQMQMAQFIYLIFHFLRAYVNKDCDEPKWLMIFGIVQAVVMLILFSNFYYKTYIKTPSSSKKLKYVE